MKIQDRRVDRLIDIDITVDLDHHDTEIGIEIEIGIGTGIEIETEIENLDQEADLGGEGLVQETEVVTENGRIVERK